MLKIVFFIIIIILFTFIIKNNNMIENMDNINDYGTLMYSKKYKDTLKKKNIFFLERGFLKKKFINPINKRIDRNMKLLDNAFGIYKNFLKNI